MCPYDLSDIYHFFTGSTKNIYNHLHTSLYISAATKASLRNLAEENDGEEESDGWRTIDGPKWQARSLICRCCFFQLDKGDNIV